MDDDTTLLHRFVHERSQPAFSTLVERHLGMVYATALRRVGGDAHRARDVAQSVFIDLARKAGALLRCRVLAGWLHTSTVYAAAKVVRAEQRRRHREQEAQRMQELNQPPCDEAEWAALRPVLDDALHQLNTRDREAIVLRFFGQRGFAEIGAALQTTESAARMRVDRALERLRGHLVRRGVPSTLAALGTALSGQAAIVPPTGLAGCVTTAAAASGSAGGVTLFFHLLGMSKLHVACSSLLLAAGIATVGSQWHARTELRHALERATTPGPAIASPAEATATDRSAPNARPPAEAAPPVRANVAAQEVARLRVQVSALRAQVQEARDQRGRAPAPSAAVAQSKDRYDASQLDEAPRMAYSVAPQYPFELKSTGIPGSVTIHLVIDESGKVLEAVPLDSTHPTFTTAALAAVQRWRFAPGRKDDQPVRTEIDVPIAFSIQDPTWF